MTVACGDDNGDEVGNAQVETETETGEPTGDGDGDPTGDGDGEPTGDGDGDGDGDATGDGDGDGDATGDGDGDGDATGDGDGDGDATGDGDGEPNLDCYDIDDQGECEGNPDCQAVTGSPLKKNGQDGPCLEPAEFLGCIPMQGCGDAETWFCENNKQWLVPDTCGPEDVEQCDAPEEPVEDCP